MYYEILEHIDIARDREKQVKSWKYNKKIEFIESKNKFWRNLYEDLTRDPSSPDVTLGSSG